MANLLPWVPSPGPRRLGGSLVAHGAGAAGGAHGCCGCGPCWRAIEGGASGELCGLLGAAAGSGAVDGFVNDGRTNL